MCAELGCPNSQPIGLWKNINVVVVVVLVRARLRREHIIEQKEDEEAEDEERERARTLKQRGPRPTDHRQQARAHRERKGGTGRGLATAVDSFLFDRRQRASSRIVPSASAGWRSANDTPLSTNNSFAYTGRRTRVADASHRHLCTLKLTNFAIGSQTAIHTTLELFIVAYELYRPTRDERWARPLDERERGRSRPISAHSRSIDSGQLPTQIYR